MTAAYDLDRFVAAQERAYDSAYAELRAGRKRTHWMWFVFPQIAGLGHSVTALLYALSGVREARAYLDHPVLGPRLRECVEAALAHKGCSAHDIFASPDDLKFHSSLTLFALAAPDEPLFAAALDQFFAGARDHATLALMESPP